MTLLRILLFGAIAYVVVLIHARTRRADRRPIDVLDVALAAALAASVAAFSLTEPEDFVSGPLAVSLLLVAHGAVVHALNRGRRQAGPTPMLLLYHGEFADSALRAAGLTRDQLLHQLRIQGVEDPPAPTDVLVREASGEVRYFRIGLGHPLDLSPASKHPDPRLN